MLAVRRLETGARELGRLRWGLVPGRWAEKASGRPLINARAETLQSQPAFRESFAERRCLIPADGFYEWLTDERGKRPVWFSRPDGELFAFAGIWAALARQRHRRRAPQLRDRHHRAERPHPPDPRPDAGDPRAPDREAEWLDPERDVDDLISLLVPAAEDALIAREVYDLVNDVREDGPRLIEPREEQGALF